MPGEFVGGENALARGDHGEGDFVEVSEVQWERPPGIMPLQTKIGGSRAIA